MTAQKKKYWKFKTKRHKFRVLLDKVLLFRYIRKVHGRFWGITGILGMSAGFAICFLIRPDLIDISTAFSDFALDIRTAPYFAGAVFFGAYGLWRWRNYLAHSWRRKMPILGLITMTMLGLYLVALMPLSWQPWPYRLHILGVSLAGISMFATVVLDGLLSKPNKKSKSKSTWSLVHVISIIAIFTGGWLTLGSIDAIAIYDVSLLGETLMLVGYATWIGLKTYQGEGSRTTIAKILKDFVLID